MSKRCFDPLLDPGVMQPPFREGASAIWAARWIWYPGQRAAHLHARAMAASVARCRYVNYPGSFRQPVNVAYFRRRAVLADTTFIRWAGPRSRLLVRANGSGPLPTDHEMVISAGEVELRAQIDFCQGLPCLLLEGGALSSGSDWEASLDGREWVPAEFESANGRPAVRPDSGSELTVCISPDRAVALKGAKQTHTGLLLEAGGEAVVDFFHAELGRLSLIAHGSGTLEVQVGEYLAEVQDERPQFQEQLPLHPVQVSSVETRSILPERCIRFARIHASGKCEISNLQVEARVHPVHYHGSFECDDPQLNEIWAASAATLHACMHSFFLDGLRRDGLPWAADGLAAIEASDCVFFDETIARNTLVSQMLPDRPTQEDFGIIDYPLYVPLGIEHDYLVRGDMGFAQAYRPRMVELLEFLSSLQDDEGFVSAARFKDRWFLPDWAQNAQLGPDLGGIPTYVQMLLMRCFQIGASFSRHWNDEANSDRWSAVAEKMRRNIRHRFWDSSANAYINGITGKGELDRRLTSYAQVWGVLLDLMTPSEAAGVVDSVLTNPACRAGNLSFQLPWEYQAFHQAGQMQPVLAQLRQVWGHLLDQGYSRFPEDIRPADDAREALALYGRPYANSLCHVWAGAAPILALSRGLLGIYPAGPGYSTCHIAPQLAGLRWIKGRIPTPRGPIELEYSTDGGTLRLPPGVTATDGTTQWSGEGTFRLLERTPIHAY